MFRRVEHETRKPTELYEFDNIACKSIKPIHDAKYCYQCVVVTSPIKEDTTATAIATAIHDDKNSFMTIMPHDQVEEMIFSAIIAILQNAENNYHQDAKKITLKVAKEITGATKNV